VRVRDRASYAGKCAGTITSGPGISLKQEDRTRRDGRDSARRRERPEGGRAPASRPRPNRGDLLTTIFGSHGDAPKIVLAPSNHRRLPSIRSSRAQDRRDLQHGRRRLVGRQSGDRPDPVCPAKFDTVVGGGSVDQSALSEELAPYAWDAKTVSRAVSIPGQPGGMHTLRVSLTTRGAASPTTRRSTSKESGQEASSSPRFRNAEAARVFGG